MFLESVSGAWISTDLTKITVLNCPRTQAGPMAQLGEDDGFMRIPKAADVQLGANGLNFHADEWRILSVDAETLVWMLTKGNLALTDWEFTRTDERDETTWHGAQSAQGRTC